jgi:signal transduction histidine kinase
MTLVHSLRLRLLLVLFLVALVPVGTAAYLIHRATAHAFHSYSEERTRTDALTVATQFGELTGHPAVVVDAGGTQVGGSVGYETGEAGEPGQAAAPDDVASGAVTGQPTSGSATIGSFAGTASGSGSGSVTTISLPGLPDEKFLSAMTHALLIAVGLAAVGALVLAVFLSRRIVKPVETLTAAARGMAAGNLQQRVAVRSQDEIGVLADAFNTMADSRTRLETLRRNLVNDVAHELRTPLANLQGYLEVLRDGLTPPTPEVLAVLHDESLLLSRLVTDLQDLALAEAGQLSLAPEPVDLTEPIATALDALRPQADAKQLTLAATLPDTLPQVDVDLARLSQILRILLRNAIAHTPPGGSIEVNAAANQDGVAVAVRDTGSGIPPEHLPYVFDRFYRADPARARATGGAGLGLAIVKHLVEAHNGQIDVTSTPGAGATFTFTLPRAVAR